MREKVEEILNMVRPHLQADGGDVELIDVTDDGVVKVKLPKVPAGRNYAIAILKVTDHDTNTNYNCVVGILNK